jgi:hypothetical protein
MRNFQMLLAELDELREKVARLESELAWYRDRECQCPFAEQNNGVCPE